MFDVSDKNSFDKVGYWLHELSNEKQQPEILLLGNKIDKGERQVSDEMVENFGHQNGGLRVSYSSAKSGEGIDDAFRILLESITKNKEIMSRMKTNGSVLNMEDVGGEKASSGEKDCC